MCKVMFAWRGFFGFVGGEDFLLLFGVFFLGGWVFCGGLFLINVTKSSYTSCQPSFWPYREKTKRKKPCFPEFGHCPFLKLEHHKVINASSKRI